MTESDEVPEGQPLDRDEWMRRTGPLYPALVALRQLTKLPVLRGVEPTTEDLTRAAPWYPAVGGLVGGLVALVALIVLKTDLVPAIGGAAVLVLAIVISGALHESGFARAIESLFSGSDATEDLYSRRPIGLQGVAALVALLAARAFLLLGIDPHHWIGALLVSQILLRWTPIFLLRLGDRLGDPVPGERGLLVGNLSWAALAIGSGFALLVAILFGGGTGFLALLLAAAVAFGAGVFYQRRDGGLGENALAASSVAGELVALLVFAFSHPAIISPWTS